MSAPASGRFRVIVEDRTVYSGEVTAPSKAAARAIARYLADAARRRPELADTARRLVLTSAESVWDNRAEVATGPVFAHDWRKPARVPAPGTPEADLSVQLSGWMLLEAAATLA